MYYEKEIWYIYNCNKFEYLDKSIKVPLSISDILILFRIFVNEIIENIYALKLLILEEKFIKCLEI